jgi:hypothetical protein
MHYKHELITGRQASKKRSVILGFLHIQLKEILMQRYIHFCLLNLYSHRDSGTRQKYCAHGFCHRKHGHFWDTELADAVSTLMALQPDLQLDVHRSIRKPSQKALYMGVKGNAP